MDSTQCQNIFLKLGEEGVFMHIGGTDQHETDQINALNSAPIDTAGAGDSLLITSALCKAAGATIWQTALLGSIAAAIQVSRVGNIPITKDEIIEAVKSFKF